MSTSNAAQVFQWLDNWVHSFDMTRPGREQSLGRDIAMTIIRGPDAGSPGGILGRCKNKVTPEGDDWPEADLTSPYNLEKQAKYGWTEEGRRTNQTLSQASLYGRTTIEAQAITMRYGLGEPPSDSGAPTAYLSKQDKQVTDEQKAGYLHQMGYKFYGVNQEDAKNVSDICQENLNDLIRETNRGD